MECGRMCAHCCSSSEGIPARRACWPAPVRLRTPHSSADHRIAHDVEGSCGAKPTIIPPINNDESRIAATGMAVPMPMTNKVMSSVANLAQLLPTGTVLTYPALSPSFTNHGKCETSNQWLTMALVAVLASACIFFSFTDSVIGHHDGKLYYGVATPDGFNVFNFSDEDERREWAGLDEFRRLRLRLLDFVHAFFTAVVFLTETFSDVSSNVLWLQS